MDTMKGFNQHKAMASGGDMASGDFGCKDLSHSKGQSMGMDGMKSGATSDGGRGAKGPVKHMRGKMRAQSNPDHGSHS